VRVRRRSPESPIPATYVPQHSHPPVPPTLSVGGGVLVPCSALALASMFALVFCYSPYLRTDLYRHPRERPYLRADLYLHPRQ